MTRAGLYLDDRQIARALGVPVDLWRANAVVLARKGLPEPDPLFEGRRYWPAVKAFLDRRWLLAAPSPRKKPDGEEHWEVDDDEAEASLFL